MFSQRRMPCCTAYLHLLLVILKLKSWKLLSMTLVLAAVTSNLYLYAPIDSWIMEMIDDGLLVVGPKEFQQSSIVVADKSRDQKEVQILSAAVDRMTGSDFVKDNLESCDWGVTCQEKYFKMLLGKKPGKIAHLVEFQPSSAGPTQVKCQLSSSIKLYCPIMAYLAGISATRDEKVYFQFNRSNSFLLKSSTRVFESVNRGGGTLCKTDLNFPSVFPRTLMAQMIFVAITLTFYLVVNTISSIHELKQHGFLQLMFRRGLSVLAYWFALWTTLLLEMGIFAATLTLAYHFQCIYFFPTSRLLIVFLSSFAQFCCMAAFVLLFSVLTRRIVVISILTSLLCLAVVACIVINRMILSQPKYISQLWPKYIILAVPFGHIAEQMYSELLKDDLKSSDPSIKLVLPVCGGLFGFLVIVTIYLDYVLKSGSGLQYPNAFMFRPWFYSINSRDRKKLPDPQESVMFEPVTFGAKPILCTSGLKKSFKKCCERSRTGLKGFSVQFHEHHITAIFGHNGAGKSVLMELLAGERLPDGGRATFNNLLITDPLCRSHISHDIGYCPQSDALVEFLTVRDMIRMTVYSSGLSWSDGVEDHVNKLLSTLQLSKRVSNTIHSLPSSDKRKVCVAIALVGMPKLILLDQPTRDMDYITKRRMWDLLYEYKRKGCIIIFCTHFIDEADGMADRMIFMSGGRAICGGSSFFFRRAFDCRFIIRIVSKTEFHVPQIGRKITAKFPSMRVRSIGRAALELEVSLVDDHILPAVMEEVESLSSFIESFGIVHNSLENLFNKLKPLTHSEVEEHFQSGTIGYLVDDFERNDFEKNLGDSEAVNDEKDDPPEPSKIMTIVAMLIANALQIKRCSTKLFVRVIVPTILLALLILAAVFERRSNNHRMQVKFDLSDTRSYETRYGACFFYWSLNNVQPDGTHKHDAIPQSDCVSMLTGFTNSTGSAGVKAIQLNNAKFKDFNFEAALLETQNFDQIQKICEKTDAPCPIVYSTSWCTEYKHPVETHNVYVGAYVKTSSYSPTSVTMTLIEAYYHLFVRTAMKYRTSNISIITTTLDLSPRISAEGNIDIKGIFFPFYGLFVQIIILAVVPAIYLNDVIEDKKSGVYAQLVSMSVSHLHYWICTFFHHWFQLALVYILSTLLLIVILIPGYTNSFFLVFVALPTLILGLANSLLCVYIVSTMIHKVSYLFVASYACFSVLASLALLPAQSNDLVGQILIAVLPQCAIVAPTLYGVRFVHYSLSYFKPTDADVLPDLLPYILAVGHVRDALVALLAHFLLMILILMLIESWSRIKEYCCCKNSVAKAHPRPYSEDVSIAEEVKKIEAHPKSEENVMEVRNLQVKSVYNEQMLKDLTFGMKRGEVFGMLGSCSSGNQAALKAIVGSRIPTSGQVLFHVDNEWIYSGKAVRRCFIGYCPKDDPLVDMLTVKENLEFYSRSIGLNLERVGYLLQKLRLEGEINIIANRATASVKRRLTLAIALLLSPRFIAIDQASAGVDPEGREILWHTIKSLAKSKERSIIIATQDIEEAKKLCGRVCIMNEGLMAALNTVEELTQIYKKMYFLEIQLGDTSNKTLESIKTCKQELIDIVRGKFREAVVIEQLTQRVQFGIPIPNVGLMSSALRWLLKKKTKLNLLYFIIHMATIDQTMMAILANHEHHVYHDELEESENAIITQPKIV